MIGLRWAVALLLCGLCALGCSTAFQARDTAVYQVLQNVRVIDVIAAEVLSPQTVVLRDSLIYYIGRRWRPPRGAAITYTDAQQGYLVPGLWDMHFHLAWAPSNDSLLLPALAANGITGLRDMGGDLELLRQFRNNNVDRIAIFGAGPILDGDPPVVPDFSIAVAKPTDIPRLVDSLASGGADFLKVYSLLREPELAAIARAARERGLTFAGHLSEYVRPERSIELGQRSIEHLNRLDEIWVRDSARLAAIASAMLRHNTGLCPTLGIYQLKATLDNPTAISEPQYERFISPVLRAEWESSVTRRQAERTPVDWAQARRQFTDQEALVAYLHARGVPLLAGSDFAGMPYVYPGIGLHRELTALQTAGLSPAAVLATATINPARFLSIADRYGSVAVGKYADLVWVAGNPLESIDSLAAVRMTWRKGQVVYRAK